MYAHGTEAGLGCLARRSGSESRRGSALFGTLVICLGLMGLLFATVTISAVEVKEARVSVDDVRVKYLAESGVERGMQYLLRSISKANSSEPLENLTALFDQTPEITPYLGENADYGGAVQGAYTVRLTRLAESATSMTVRIDSSGYLPTAPTFLGPNQTLEGWHAVSVTVLLSLEPSSVFDYAYFINNWGWFYGNTIFANGNVRSNGQFDAAGYSPTVTGQPLYDGVDNTGATISLLGYQDDNGDGLEDGNDGGVFSGWDIVGAQNLKGNGGLADNQHDFESQLEMPNLSDLSIYEQLAKASNGRVTIGGAEMSNAVYGDQPTERKNLCLLGTLADPIVLDGPIVVQGNVIIGGYVTGQGVIYASENIYCPDSVIYVDGPSTARPVDNTQISTEKWLTDNKDKDFLGLFAAESIVIGDVTDSTWQHYVGGWLSSSLNKSEEDSGEDLIPNTIAGRDGVLNTADDDVLEDDGAWTVEVYTTEDATLGMIPSGSSVGDPIPGSGEDIDGDGVYDDTVTVADLDIQPYLNSGLWGGNMPISGIHDYANISTLEAYHLDAVFYTNHVFALTVLGNQPAVLNGALVSRNESIVYGTPSFTINYDCRLLGGSSGLLADYIPQTIAPPTILRWTELSEDPNHYAKVQP